MLTTMAADETISPVSTSNLGCGTALTVREYVAWALAAVVTVLFLSSFTINIILLCICKKRQTSVKTPAFENPCYNSAKVNQSDAADTNIQDIL